MPDQLRCAHCSHAARIPFDRARRLRDPAHRAADGRRYPESKRGIAELDARRLRIQRTLVEAEHTVCYRWWPWRLDDRAAELKPNPPRQYDKRMGPAAQQRDSHG